MATYAIGDVQGCYSELMHLLEVIQFDSKKDHLWFTGDLINRGLESLSVLKFVKNLEDKAVTVLGNHDLHYLAVASGVSSCRDSDTFQDILNSPEANNLYEWLRHRPLMHIDAKKQFILVHAGLSPQWDTETAFQCAREVEEILRGSHPQEFFKQMYGDLPNHWSDSLKSYERLRVITNYFTRTRFLDENGNLELHYKGRAGEQPSGYFPWFKLPSKRPKGICVIFGHWAALEGKTDDPHYFALDTGCAWGNQLTALRLDDLKFFNVNCNLYGAKK